jgi:hypothetical protein
MRSHGVGSTMFQNEFHRPEIVSHEIQNARELLVSIDLLLMQSYGWTDLALEHGFHKVGYLPEEDSLRFTVSESARLNLLARTAELNRSRYKHEVDSIGGVPATNVFASFGLKGAGSARSAFRESKRTSWQMPLDLGASASRVAELPPSYEVEIGAAKAIYDWLIASPGWRSRGEIQRGAVIDPAKFTSAIKQLLASGAVIKQGGRRQTVYKASERDTSPKTAYSANTRSAGKQ